MILIVDFGSQTAHLIGRRLRELGVASKYTYPEDALKTIQKLQPKGIILSGGPDIVDRKGAPTIEQQVFTLGIPILGICYGWQLMSYQLGGEGKITHKEFGPEMVTLKTPISLFKGLPKTFTAIVSHGYTVTKLPEGFTNLASTHRVEFTAAINEEKKLYGVQFHPEAQHTEYGIDILRNFAQDICKETLSPLVLDPDKIIQEIKQNVGNQKVIMAVSGGVDSSVAAFFIGKAVGKQLIPVYVESGLMRSGTDIRIKKLFTEYIKADVVIVQAKERFLAALRGVTDPEEKRKMIGKLYIDIFQEIAQEHKDATFLGQGTIYSDVIESKGSKHASQIKSHHNVGGLPKQIGFTLLEPLRTYYKDEVRTLGSLAGLPDEIIHQQPWPGPGYAINIRGEVTKERLLQVKLADAIVLDEMKQAGLYESVYECWAIMTGAYSTAVKGDERVFAEVVGIRSVDSLDVMTAQWTRIPHDVLAKMSSRIVNEVPNVSRVVYDITTKPPATMRWE
jgi:GMP synthase (glutamine-hydrolysing)